jgi:hypothetical protein
VKARATSANFPHNTMGTGLDMAVMMEEQGRLRKFYDGSSREVQILQTESRVEGCRYVTHSAMVAFLDKSH